MMMLMISYMNLEDLKFFDSKKMSQVYDSWPEIAEKSYKDKNLKKLNIKNIDHIILIGMGGSGSICDVIDSILSKENLHVKTVKGYTLPNTVDDRTLIIFVSVSGNTDETLTILKNAHNSKAKIAVFTSGGTIREFCKTNNIFLQHIEMIHSPRSSLVKFLFSILNTLEFILPISPKDIEETISYLYTIQTKINSNNLTSSNDALKLAEWINGIPCIYYPDGLRSSAIRFKNSLQENAKTHVISEDIIEACHNGIVAWEKPSSVNPIIIQGEDDNIKTKERWKIIKQFFEINKIDYYQINSVKGSILSKIVSLIYILDFASIYHSVINEIDPSPVPSIDFIKSRL